MLTSSLEFESKIIISLLSSPLKDSCSVERRGKDRKECRAYKLHIFIYGSLKNQGRKNNTSVKILMVCGCNSLMIEFDMFLRFSEPTEGGDGKFRVKYVFYEVLLISGSVECR